MFSHCPAFRAGILRVSGLARKLRSDVLQNLGQIDKLSEVL